MLNYFDNRHLYSAVEFQRMMISPFNMAAQLGQAFFNSPLNPISTHDSARSLGASFELFERITREYDKPEFGLTSTEMAGKSVRVYQKTIKKTTFCDLLHFRKDTQKKQEKLLVVAPMSGHYATLLRGTVEGLLPHFDVYITDWKNARDIPVTEGEFGFDDYVVDVIHFLEELGERAHVMAVCQPSVPVFAAAALMAKNKDKMRPKSMTLIGGPVDTRKSPTKVNELATHQPLEWFEKNVITYVPFMYPGFMRRVYPGFLQLTGFMQMNLDRHIGQHMQLFEHLVEGDGDGADSHRTFYDEYLSVMDLDAKFYLETIEHVFKKFSLPEGKMKVGEERVDPKAITDIAVLCIEGERDDISGIGQTKAAIDICSNLPDSKKHYHMQKNVGHYGSFNGRRYREEIVPVIADFCKKHS